MTNRTFKNGESQVSPLPPLIEGYVGPDNAVRAIEGFVCALMLEVLPSVEIGQRQADQSVGFFALATNERRLALAGLTRLVRALFTPTMGARGAVKDRANLERRSGEIKRELDRIWDAIAKIGADPASVAERLRALLGHERLCSCRRVGLCSGSAFPQRANWLDNESIAQRTRDRILGHASDVRGRYGRNGVLDPQIAAKIEALEPLVVKQMREILLAAKSRADLGELIVLKTY
jgi:hypothetical protein